MASERRCGPQFVRLRLLAVGDLERLSEVFLRSRRMRLAKMTELATDAKKLRLGPALAVSFDGFESLFDGSKRFVRLIQSEVCAREMSEDRRRQQRGAHRAKRPAAR